MVTIQKIGGSYSSTVCGFYEPQATNIYGPSPLTQWIRSWSVRSVTLHGLRKVFEGNVFPLNNFWKAV